MDNERAKIILSAYRPGGADAHDPLIREALEQARLDPELGRWFADQQTFDGWMGRAVKSVQPPTHLKAAILVAAQTAQKGREAKTGAPRRRWINPAWMALVSVLAVLIGGALLFRATAPTPIPLAMVTDRILQIRDELPGVLGATSPDPRELQRWLATHQGPNGFTLPTGLTDKNSVGCQVFNIKGNKVSLICFQMDDKRLVHYFVMDRSGLTNPPPVGVPISMQKGNTSFLAWSDNRRSYVLAEFAPASDLKKLL